MKNENLFILEQGSLQQLKEQKKRTQDLINYHAFLYTSLAVQRDKVKDAIHASLRSKCIQNYKFSKWQRSVRYKYSLHPLSCVGSTTFIGQRFNYGKEINGTLSPFPALYLAKDKKTAIHESLATIKKSKKRSELDSFDLAMTNPQSQAIVSVSGKLETVFDLRNSKALSSYISIIKKFKIDPQLRSKARLLKIDAPKLVRTSKELLGSIMRNNWRDMVVLYNTPSNGQIIGQIMLEAGICGILYKSTLNEKECLAIFPDSFKNNDSFVCLNDDPPCSETPQKLDGCNTILARMTYDDILAIK